MMISTSVNSSSEFETELDRIFSICKPNRILETGTYHGTGTTSIIHKALNKYSLYNSHFVTIEVNTENYNIAIRNTASFKNPTIKIVNGLSVPKQMLPSEDEMRNRLVQNVKDGIYYDHNPSERIALYKHETCFNVKDNIIGDTLKEFNHSIDFVLLDSAGSMGTIEFKYFMTLVNSPFYIMLDDTNHCKHVDTVEIIRKDNKFEILKESTERFGFISAKYNGK